MSEARRRPSLAPVPPAETGAPDFALDRTWHLAAGEAEIDVTEFEYALMRACEAFARWQSECLAAVTGLAMSGADNAVLHVIRMNDRPKGVTEIGRLLNRDDVANIQYSIRKLLKAGLIEKQGAENKRKGVAYRASARGAAVTESYAELRRKLLMEMIAGVPGLSGNLSAAARTLDIATGLYDQTARIAASHRKTVEEE